MIGSSDYDEYDRDHDDDYDDNDYDSNSFMILACNVVTSTFCSAWRLSRSWPSALGLTVRFSGYHSKGTPPGMDGTSASTTQRCSALKTIVRGSSQRCSALESNRIPATTTTTNAAATAAIIMTWIVTSLTRSIFWCYCY